MLQVNWVVLLCSALLSQTSLTQHTPKCIIEMTLLPFLPSLLLLWLSATPPPTMDGTTNSGEPRSSSVLQNTGASEDPNRSGSGQNSMARYKLMSPAKLPISRSPCITIPPGLSPTSFLESPVLLSNMKVSVWMCSFEVFWFRWKMKIKWLVLWGRIFIFQRGLCFLRGNGLEEGKVNAWVNSLGECCCFWVHFGQRLFFFAFFLIWPM